MAGRNGLLDKILLLPTISLVICSFVLVLGQDQAKEAKTLEAEAFVLRDKNGKVRARLGCDSEGFVVLGLKDLKGKDRAAMMLWPDGSPLIFVDYDHDKMRTMLGVSDIGKPGLLFRDKDGTDRMGILYFDLNGPPKRIEPSADQK